MAEASLLHPTLHIEIQLTGKTSPAIAEQIRDEVTQSLRENYTSLQVGRQISEFDNGEVLHASYIGHVAVADYTGPDSLADHHELEKVQLDVQSYTLHNGQPRPTRRTLSSSPLGCSHDEDESPTQRLLLLPNVALKDEWDSLIYDDGLPSQLLRYLTRMLGVMKQPCLNLATFNWNRLCLLHGPPGSGKTTLCRALAQKLSIRLSQTFPRAVLVEVNTNALLSKYFGESGKQIEALFEKLYITAQASDTLVCVVMDEVETIAGSREQVASGGECSDGMRATNQLLTALDRLRAMPNIIVMCTSNLMQSIDTAFLDRVDIKALIPSPSPEAIYNIFRSCLNELVRASLIDMSPISVSATLSPIAGSSNSRTPSSSKRPAFTRSNKASTSASISTTQSSKHDPSQSRRIKSRTRRSPMKDAAVVAVPVSQEPQSPFLQNLSHITIPTIPTFPETTILFQDDKESPGQRVWSLAQKCVGFSGRTLRRLPILGLAMYTWGGICTLSDAVSALEAAVKQELKAKQEKT